MEEVSLTETESRYFSDLFLCCDVEKTGKIPMLEATELYRSANLTDDVILEITSLAGIPATALHISRAQFYSCLKLIAAYQASMPLRQELIAATVQLPLPRFSWKKESPSCLEMANTITTNAATTTSFHHQANGISAIPPPPATDRKNSLTRRGDWQEAVVAAGSRRNSAVHQQQHQQQQQQQQQLQQLQQEAAVNSDVPSTDSEVEQQESSCGGGGGGGGGTGSSGRELHRRRGSPEAWSTNSDSPTPTNSVAERPWAKENIWQGLLGDEHRQLLGTEEESSDHPHSSDDDNETDLETVYQITPEQREYYFKQFKAVQHDPNGLLSGQVARVFFEKSRIPVEELRHIWQLCDVTRDGALSLAEFTAAMHLVVLRRNNIPLPAVLPACLHPNVLQPQEPPEADLLHLNDDDDEDNTDNTIVGGNNVRLPNEKNVMNLSTLSASSQTSTNSRQAALTPTGPVIPSAAVKNRSVSNSPNFEANTTGASPTNLTTAPPNAVARPKDRSLWTTDVPPTQWTKFTESPTSNVSSPGPKPVNFDMQRTAQAVVSDPQILHPVPLRVTPVAGTLATTTIDVVRQDSHDGVILCSSSPKQIISADMNVSNSSTGTSGSHHRDSLQSSDLRAIQRPQAKKLPVKNIGALPPPPQRGMSGGSGDGDQLVMTVANNQPTQLQQLPAVVNKKDPPPLPPPRPTRHGRSSSLDLNKFKMNPSGGQQPEITAQASFDLQTSAGFADFTQFPDSGSAANVVSSQIAEQEQHSLPPETSAPPSTRFLLQSNQRVSAFEVYRKPKTPRSSQSPTTTTLTTATITTITSTSATQKSTSSQQAITTDLQALSHAHAPNQSQHHHHHHHHHQQHHNHPQPTQPPPPAPAPFGSVGAAAIAQNPQLPITATTSSAGLPNADLYEKRVNAISETLRHVSFKHDNNMSDVLRHLREQNNLLLRLCNDLSDELLTVQTLKEEMRLKFEAISGDLAVSAASISMNNNNNNNNNSSSSSSGALTASMIARTGSSISAPVTANITGGSGSSGVHSNV